MLSIIISSYQEKYFAEVEKNISETVGIPYEIIRVWNPKLMSLCHAYNKGAQDAQFQNLLFLHEDIHFNQKNWGTKLVQHLDQPKIGVVGIAGSNYVSKSPSGWFIKGYQDFEKQLSTNPEDTLTLDGVFLAVKKEVFTQYLFAKYLPGFHGYDIDFSLRIAKNFKNKKISDIDITHFSGGNPDRQFLENLIIIRNQLGHQFQHQKIDELETNAFISFVSGYFRYFPINFKNTIFTLK